MATYVLALDQGTSSSRAILFDHAGAPVAQASREFPQIYPQPGWVSHDPEAIWSSQLEAAGDVLARTATAAGDIAAIGITNQRETTIVWERASGRAINDAVVWQCRRTAGICEELRARGLEPEVRARTGLLIDAYFSGTKVRWLLDNSGAGMQQRAEAGELAFGTVDSWLIHKLTGGRAHVIDATNASRTMLYNLRDGAWDERMLAELRIPAAMLPQRGRQQRRHRRDRPGDLRPRRSRSRASRATSRPRSSARAASRRAMPRTPTAPAVSSCSTPATGPCSRSTGC